jgi:cell division protein FtsB
VADEPKEVAVTGELKYLAYGISIIVVSTALIGCFSFAWQVSLQLNSATQEIKSLTATVNELKTELNTLKKEHESSKEQTQERLNDLRLRP